MSDADVRATVEAVMTHPVARIDAGESVSAAARRLYDDRIGSLLVESDGVVGIVTETDVVGLVARGEPETTSVGDIATRSLVTIERDALVEEAAERMHDCDIKKLPVTDDGEIVGIVTTTDVSNYFPSYHPREDPWS